jgi:hypothetical protein
MLMQADSEDRRIQRAMEKILRKQADPDRPSPLVEQWAYFEERDRTARRFYEKHAGGGNG